MSIVLFPYSNGMGHLIPMVELAKLFTNHNLSVTILILTTPHSSPISSSFISRVSSTHPSISFHTLPTLDLSPTNLPSSPPIATHHLIRQSNHLLLHYLQSSKTNIRALVVDMFCTSAIDVAKQLSIPSYLFFASGASALSAFVLTPALLDSRTVSFRDLGDSPLNFPGLPPIPASHMPVFMQEPDSDMCKARLYDFARFPMADGIMINTVEEMERRAVVAMMDGTCYPGRQMPPVYCIGPLVGGTDHNKNDEKHECLTWLDEQPRGSVVFLSFGSVGAFSREQLKEISIGLENSGQRFLWVVRNPPSEAKNADVDLDGILPEGFLERTMGRGMVVKSWAPQAQVLRHESVGGFVTHCGWNSVLEAVSCRVAMIAWPMYAEQWMNKVVLVEEMRLAVAMEGYDKEVVSGEEVERKVQWLMESEGGRELKERAAAMREVVVKARKEGGSSERTCGELVKALKKD